MSRYLVFDTKIIDVTQVVAVDVSQTDEATVATFSFSNASEPVEVTICPKVEPLTIANVMEYVQQSRVVASTWRTAYRNC